MSHFILHTKSKGTMRPKYLMAGLACLMTVCVVGFTLHNIGITRAKSRETVLIYTEEEFAQYLIDTESEEYNLNGRYQLEEDLDLSWLEYSIGTNLEPFTGKLCGNGHVISGLERPLFGVLERAEIEDLFLSNASIANPFTYSDGERYVDGYGALAAYAVDSTIRNCGMEGRIDTASPSEAEYLLAKASPSDADERSGPGAEGPGVIEEVSEENGANADGNGTEGGAAGPGEETETEPEHGPGVEDSGLESSLESSTEESGPGIESDSETGTDATESTKASEAATNSTNSTNNAGNTGNIGNTGSTVEGGLQESTDSKPPESDISSGHPTDSPSNDGHDEGKDAAGADDNTSETEKEQETSPVEGSSAPVTDSAPDGAGGIPNDSAPTVTGEESDRNASAGGAQAGSDLSAGSHSVEDGSSVGIPSETIGYRSNERQHLMMKVSAVMDSDMEELLMASPSNATPSDAEELAEDSSSDDGNSGEDTEGPDAEGITYIGNPDGDVCILVTAERVTAGGLLAQTAGETLISNSFVLVTISSRLEETETYAGGIAGMIGDAVRVENSYASGLADGDGVTGGFAAVNDGYIENCYSTVTVGEAGTGRGAFTAGGEGMLSGCIYDRQMACADDGKMELVTDGEAGLKALNTVRMVGKENEVPGEWRKVENAYPQLEYFALHEHEAVTASSRASAIALVLPEELTLADVVKKEELVLPSEIDGEEIIWETDGTIKIEEKTPVISEEIPVPSIEENDIPVVGSALESTTDSDTAEETSDGESLELKASVGNVTRNFSIAAVAAARTIYADWEKVGEAVEKGEISGVSRPDKNSAGYYEIGSAEQLAWFAYKVNSGENTINALVTADIDMIGDQYGGSVDTPLTWVPIAKNGPIEYSGIFDGGYHKIDYLRMTGKYAALIGKLSCGEVRKVHTGSNCILGAGDDPYVGGIASNVLKGVSTISDCVSEIEFSSTRYAGGMVGGVDEGGALHLIRCCYLGTGAPAAGFVAWYSSASKRYTSTVEDCYSAGSFVSYPLGGTYYRGDVKSINSYYLNGSIGKDDVTATKLTDAKMRSWGFAYALNNQSVEGSWQYNEGGYPTPSGAGRMVKAPSWADVSQGIQDGLIQTTGLTTDSSTGAYSIKSAEQLSSFARLVNNGSTGIKGQLDMDINMAGEKYGGSAADPVLWEPIGNAENIFQGTFDGKGNVLGSLSVNKAGYAGLFGCAGGGAVIQNLGLDSSCKVVSSGAADGVDGTAGFVGAVLSVSGKTDNITIKNCYSRASVKGSSSKTGAFVGSYEAGAAGIHMISHCYTAGKITSTSGTPGAIAGSFADYSESTGGIRRCFWDGGNNPGTSLQAVGGGAGTATDGYSEAKTTAYMKGSEGSDTANILLDLNTGNLDGEWVRLAGRNNEYPIFSVRVGAADWGTVGASVFAPRCQVPTSSGTAGNADNPYLIWTSEDLAWVADQINNQGRQDICAKLMADINLFGGLYTGIAYDSSVTVVQALPWIPMGSDSGGTGYTGTFDGNGYTISMMYVKGTEKLGLFGTLGTGASVSGIVLSDSRLESDGSVAEVTYVGGIAGYLGGNNALITGCRNEGVLELPEAGAYFGGIAGYITGSGNAVTLCENSGTVTGTGNYLGGIAGGIEGGTGVIIDGCYNSQTGKVANIGKMGTGGILGGNLSGDTMVRNCYNQGAAAGGLGGTNVGGIVGTASAESRISGCYNAGTVTGAVTGGTVKSIAGSNAGSGNISYCYYISGSAYPVGSYPADENATGLEAEVFGTWGAAFALNGEILKQTTGISWTWVTGENYPKPRAGALSSAESWEKIGEGIGYGLWGERPTGDGNAVPYQITTPEHLAWFAYQVNVAGKPGNKAVLAGDVDMKTAESRYVSEGRLSWMPIGKDGAAAYKGNFESRNLSDVLDTRRIYQIQNLYVDMTGTAGLFGTVTGGTVSRIGLANAVVKGNNAGGIVGNASGATTIAQCYNRSEDRGDGSGNGSVTASGNAGGIVGQTAAGVTVRDCYNLETVIMGTGASSFVGGIVGGGAAGTIRNSYNACGTAGGITASGTGAAGAVNGNPGAGSGMSQCYSDTGWKGSGVSLADSNFVIQLYSTGNTQLKEQTAGLNTVSGVQQMRENRIWYTSLAAEATKGWPTLEPPVKMLSLGAVTPVDDTSGAAGLSLELGAAGTIPDVRLRYAGQETTGTETVSLVEWKTEYYNSYGTTSANGKAGMSGIAGDTATVLSPDQMSLENPVQDLGTISGLKVYTGAACIYPTDRDILVELSSGNDRYELRFTIKGVSGKSLTVDLPVDVAMEELMPDGAEKSAYSADTAIENNQTYPIEGKILKVTPISETDRAGYRVLKPIAQGDNYAGGQLYDSGVKLGITDPKTGAGVISGELYYNPKAAGDTNPWVTYQLKAGGTFLYRYIMKYKSDPYYDTEHSNFGYIISYQFGVMADDYRASTDAVAVQ